MLNPLLLRPPAIWNGVVREYDEARLDMVGERVEGDDKLGLSRCE
jgi:hypothetical protein